HDYASSVEQWLQSYEERSTHALFENSVVGTLSTDGQRVYAVDDLALPPYPSNMPRGGRNQALPDFPEYTGGLAEAVESSRLLALDGASGELLWTAGGRGTPESS